MSLVITRQVFGIDSAFELLLENLESKHFELGEERWSRPAITELPARPNRRPTSALISEKWKLVRIGVEAPEDARFEHYRYREDPCH